MDADLTRSRRGSHQQPSVAGRRLQEWTGIAVFPLILFLFPQPALTQPLLQSAQRVASTITLQQEEAQESRWRPRPAWLVVGGITLAYGLWSMGIQQKRGNEAASKGERTAGLEDEWETAAWTAIGGGVIAAIGLIGKREPVSSQSQKGFVVVPKKGGGFVGRTMSW